MTGTDRIRLFAMSHQMLERDLDAVERRFGVDLGRSIAHDAQDGPKDEAYYPQFKESVRREAAAMSEHYEVFYSLEKSIRELVIEKMKAEHGAGWWETQVQDSIRNNVARNMERERDAGFTMRSTEPLDYTTFGELGEIVRANWTTFNDTFNSEKAFTKIMTSLNILRGPIAHCSPLAEDETVRLRLTLKDWFRLME